ncbi:MAG: hypothetical protein IPF66_23125, partial [Holophagales bacterium]|nr:hypothetical protein [Holophagales bacterium]
HARKMAALLETSTASDPAEKPVLLWVDRDAGPPPGQAARPPRPRRRRPGMFLMWQLGMLK